MQESIAGKTVAVTGATGFVGRHLCRALVDRGAQVRALTRDLSKAREALPPNNMALVHADIDDEPALRDLVFGADAVIHLIGIRRELGRGVTFRRLHVGATERILRATTRAGVSRYLHMSALGARGDAVSNYHKTKYEAEWLVRRSGLDWTIFRPSIIHGPDGEFMQMAAGWVRGEEQPKFFLPYFFRNEPLPGEDSLSGRMQPVHVD
ncbi:MAG: NAD(P)H-binding protein, partial [Planctomycetota bacterium]|nr:NAD(P)H-binding protein [Planctomycetota bacterium]